jgi:bifunctional non-homologous end joining protein LigD
VPSGERWIHEIKFDGYRVQVHLGNETIKVFTRRGNDWTNRFKKIANDAFLINTGSASNSYSGGTYGASCVTA